MQGRGQFFGRRKIVGLQKLGRRVAHLRLEGKESRMLPHRRESLD